MVLFKQICAFAHEAGENKTKILQVAGFAELQSCRVVTKSKSKSLMLLRVQMPIMN